MAEEIKETKNKDKALSKQDVKITDSNTNKQLAKKSDETKNSDKKESDLVDQDKKVKEKNPQKYSQGEKKDLKISSSAEKNVSTDSKKNTKLSVKKTSTNTVKDKSSTRKDSDNTESGDNQNKSAEQAELSEKLVSINRVAKVVKGGRRFSFAALVVVGDGNGMVGHGKGKAKEVPEAIKKATDEAKNNMIRVPLRQGRTLHHDIKGRYDAGKVYLRSAPSGTGVIAGGPMRAVFEALGIQDIVAKSVGTSNPHNMVRATFEALKSASSPKIIAMRRGLKINDITKRRKMNQQGLEDGKN